MQTLCDDYKTLCRILEKEARFEKEVALLTHELHEIDLDDYLAGLKDLKSDFLLPYKTALPDSFTKSTAFSDRYHFFEKT